MPRGRSKKVSDDDIVETIKEWPKDGKLPSTSNLKEEINEKLDEDYDRKTVYRRLDALVAENTIAKIEVGRGRGRSIGWYHPNHYNPGQSADSGPTGSAGGEPMTDGGFYIDSRGGSYVVGYDEHSRTLTKGLFMAHLSIIVLGIVGIGSAIAGFLSSNGLLFLGGIGFAIIGMTDVFLQVLYLVFGVTVFDRIAGWCNKHIFRGRLLK